MNPSNYKQKRKLNKGAVMKNWKLLLSITLLFNALAHSEESMCSSTEKILFSCISGKKIISICGSPGFSLSSGYVRYKFGVAGKEPELLYPQDQATLSQAFKYAYSDYSKGSTQELSFSRGKYKYTIHVDAHSFRGWASGVFVEIGDKQVAYLRCDKDQPTDALYWATEAGMTSNEPRYIGTPGE